MTGMSLPRFANGKMVEGWDELSAIAEWDDPAQDARQQAWATAFFEAVQPYAAGVYVNFLQDEGEARVREAYQAATFERLAAVKAQYDPTNLFRQNQNIRPQPAPQVPQERAA